jgi:hypothetical protein
MSQVNRYNYLQHSFENEKDVGFECGQRFSSSSLNT